MDWGININNKCLETHDRDIRHIGCGGSIFVDGIGKMRRPVNVMMARNKMAVKFAWFKTYRGGCDRCHKETTYFVEKPYRKTVKFQDYLRGGDKV